MKFVHSAGIIHRDIKPANILIDGNCQVKICDFGFSRISPNPPQNYDFRDLNLSTQKLNNKKFPELLSPKGSFNLN